MRWRADGRERPGSNPGIVQVDTEDSHSQRVRSRGVDCLRVFNPFGAAWVYFRFQSDAGRSLGAVRVCVEVLCEANASLWIEYDSSDEAVSTVPDSPGAFKLTPATAFENTGRWVRFDFDLPDANFRRRVNGADFRVVMGRKAGESMHIRSITVVSSASRRAAETAPGRQERAVNKRRVTGLRRDDRPEVSIVVPVLDQLAYTLQCLDHVSVNTAGSYEVIVVDDGSGARTLEALSEIEGLRVIRNPANRGFARACNRGAEVARGQDLLFLNNDTVPMPGWMSALVACLRQHPRVGVVGSKLLYPFSNEIQHAGVRFDKEGVPYHVHQFQPADFPPAQLESEVPAVTGACLLTTARLFAELGGFDDGYANGFEDIDYCLRARQTGYRVLYCPRSVLLHYESVSTIRGGERQKILNRNRFQSLWSSRLEDLTGHLEGVGGR